MFLRLFYVSQALLGAGEGEGRHGLCSQCGGNRHLTTVSVHAEVGREVFNTRGWGALPQA